MGLKRALAVVVAITLATGCFGYNKSAKRWAYVGNTVLILGGGGAIAADQLSSKEVPSMTTTAARTYEPPFSGALLAGVVLVTAGLVGIVFTATRPNLKTSR
ncbi:MAG: hypothetical protein H6Q90_4439 [Deltaproteobacteria bacterium]|nr:hypothetical protein [Deltaproteobacteria bacterium]